MGVKWVIPRVVAPQLLVCGGRDGGRRRGCSLSHSGGSKALPEWGEPGCDCGGGVVPGKEKLNMQDGRLKEDGSWAGSSHLPTVSSLTTPEAVVGKG